MAENTKIEWCTHTVNLWWGCTKVHAGCDNCYAEVLSNRWQKAKWGNDSPRVLVNNWERDLMKYQKLAAEAGEIHTIFIGSMMDIFEKPMSLVDNKKNKVVLNPNALVWADTSDIRNKLFNEIVPLTPNLVYLFLTKRPSNINKYIPDHWKIEPPENVMFGCSPVDQKTADKLIPQLLKVKGKKFLSVEPMLDNISLTAIDHREEGGRYSYWLINCLVGSFKLDGKEEWIPDVDLKIDWVIVGGESGANKRLFNTDWARSIRDQCASAGVPFFMKQIDKIKPIPESLMIRQFPKFK